MLRPIALRARALHRANLRTLCSRPEPAECAHNGIDPTSQPDLTAVLAGPPEAPKTPIALGVLSLSSGCAVWCFAHLAWIETTLLPLLPDVAAATLGIGVRPELRPGHMRMSHVACACGALRNSDHPLQVSLLRTCRLRFPPCRPCLSCRPMPPLPLVVPRVARQGPTSGCQVALDCWPRQPRG